MTFCCFALISPLAAAWILAAPRFFSRGCCCGLMSGTYAQPCEVRCAVVTGSSSMRGMVKLDMPESFSRCSTSTGESLTVY